jgi:hypothetical protein
MNRGLKKPRHGFTAAGASTKTSAAQPAPEPQPQGAREDYTKGASYLSRNVWRD